MNGWSEEGGRSLNSLRYLRLLDKVKGNSTCRGAEEDEVTAMKGQPYLSREV